MVTEVLVKETLPERMIEAGERLLKLLRQEGMKINASFWLYNSDYNSWRLVLAMPAIKTKSATEAYKKILQHITDSGDKTLNLLFESLNVVDATEQTAKVIEQAAEVYDLPVFRVSHFVLDGVLVEDAYVYRAA